MEYYIVSLKHTSKGDTALTLWGPNNAGYTRHKFNAGVYTQEEADTFKGDTGNVPVLKSDADKLFLVAYDTPRERFVALPNDPSVLIRLGLDSSAMKLMKCKTCNMKFCNEPIGDPQPIQQTV